MHREDLTHLKADLQEQVGQACSALDRLLERRTELAADERALQVQALYEALVRLGRGACLLHEELQRMQAVDTPTTSGPGQRAFSAASVVEAGRKGGRKVRERYGLAYYQNLGKLGGAAL